MIKPKYQNYRVCYELGNKTIGKEIYELYKYCKCPECLYRQEMKRTPANCVTITTKDISKVDDVAEYLKNWTCEDGKRQLETVYIKF